MADNKTKPLPGTESVLTDDDRAHMTAFRELFYRANEYDTFGATGRIEADVVYRAAASAFMDWASSFRDIDEKPTAPTPPNDTQPPETRVIQADEIHAKEIHLEGTHGSLSLLGGDGCPPHISLYDKHGNTLLCLSIEEKDGQQVPHIKMNDPQGAGLIVLELVPRRLPATAPEITPKPTGYTPRLAMNSWTGCAAIEIEGPARGMRGDQGGQITLRAVHGKALAQLAATTSSAGLLLTDVTGEARVHLDTGEVDTAAYLRLKNPSTGEQRHLTAAPDAEDETE